MTDVAPVAAPPTASAPADAPDAQSQAAPEIPPSPLTWDPEAKEWVAKTKIDGKERTAKWSELHRDAQLSRSAQERFEEAKAIKQRNAEIAAQNRMLAEAFVNPRKAMEQWQAAGLDPRAMIAHMQREMDAEASLTDEQRELRDSRAKLAKIEADQRAAAERQAAADEEAAENERHNAVERTFHKWMDNLKLPAGEQSALRGHMSMLMWAIHDDIKAGNTPSMRMSEVSNEAWSEMKDLARDVIRHLSPEERAQLLGADVVTAIATSSVSTAAPLPRAVDRSAQANAQPRRGDGRFSTHTTFSNRASFQRALDRG